MIGAKYRNRFDDHTVVIKATTAKQVKVYDNTTGNTEWVNASDFAATYRQVTRRSA